MLPAIYRNYHSVLLHIGIVRIDCNIVTSGNCMKNFNILICSIFFSFFAVSSNSEPMIKSVENLFNQVMSDKTLKNIEKARIKDQIIQQLNDFISDFISSGKTDREALESAKAIASNKALLTQKTKPVLLKLLTMINDAFARVQKLEAQAQYRAREEASQQEKRRLGQESVEKFFESTPENASHAVLQLAGNISSEDVSRIVDFLKNRPTISSLQLHLDSLNADNIVAILSSLEDKLEVLKIVYRGTLGINGKHLSNLLRLKSLDVSDVGLRNLSELPQSIENLDLSRSVIEKSNFEGIASLHNLQTLNLTNVKEFVDPGAEKSNIIKPLSLEFKEYLKTKLPSLKIIE